jgi:hypothetical protein
MPNPKLHVRDVPHDLLRSMSKEQLAMLDWEMSEDEFFQISESTRAKGEKFFDYFGREWTFYDFYQATNEPEKLAQFQRAMQRKENEKLNVPRHV